MGKDASFLYFTTIQDIYIYIFSVTTDISPACCGQCNTFLCYTLFKSGESFGEGGGAERRRHTEVSKKRKKEEELSLLLHSLRTCNGGLISKHVMYFTPMDGVRGGGG